jgi:D-alanyl-D-alanine carboxypeptidase
VAVGAGLALVAASCSSSSDTSTTTTTAAESTETTVAPMSITEIDQATLDATVAEIAGQTMAPGAVVLLRTPNGTLTSVYGAQTVDGTPPIALEDHFRIGSNTKTMTGTAILQLVEEGKLSLDDTIGTYVDGVPNGDRITIAQLLEMRSGLPNYSDTVELNQSLDEDPGRIWTPDELLALAFAKPIEFEPGAEYMYSNTNTILLGLVIEQLDDATLARSFQKRFFEPLGLEQTKYPLATDRSLPNPHPQGYQFGTNVEAIEGFSTEQEAAFEDGSVPPTDVTDENPSWAGAAGAAISTAEDLATWVEAMVDGELLDAATQQLRMQSMQATSDSPDAPTYGYALAGLGPFYGHTGELPGFNSFMGRDPEAGVTLIVWTNLNESPTGVAPAVAIARALIGQLYGSASGAEAPSAS